MELERDPPSELTPDGGLHGEQPGLEVARDGLFGGLNSVVDGNSSSAAPTSAGLVGLQPLFDFAAEGGEDPELELSRELMASKDAQQVKGH